MAVEQREPKTSLQQQMNRCFVNTIQKRKEYFGSIQSRKLSSGPSTFWVLSGMNVSARDIRMALYPDTFKV